MHTLYKILRPYLADNNLEVVRNVLYNDLDGFYFAINTLCKRKDYDPKNFSGLIIVFTLGLEINQFQNYRNIINAVTVHGRS